MRETEAKYQLKKAVKKVEIEFSLINYPVSRVELIMNGDVSKILTR